MKRRMGWAALVAANALAWGVLSFHQTTDASQKTGGQPPFANSVEQRMEMAGYLREIRDLLKEQNALLQSGNLRVVLGEPGKP